MAAQFKLFQALIRLFRKQIPPAYPVCVRRVALKHVEGLCWKHGKTFHIRIDKGLSELRAMDVLLHEWAHALAWNSRLDNCTTDEEFNKLAHDASWGVAYSQVYAVYEQDFPAAIK
jgi:hypothetical protein